MISEIISSPILDLGEFQIKISDRKILDGLLLACGVTKDQVRPACSAVDKLDKMDWLDVKKEMVDIKNIPEEVADKIGEYVKLNGSLGAVGTALEESTAYKLVEQLQNDEFFKDNKHMQDGLIDMKKLLSFCSQMGLGPELCFDLSLARGLDYYTGPIFETVLCGKNVGSITGGGRYDEMVAGFTKSKRKTPIVGTSFGIERIMAIVEKQYKEKNVKVKTTNTEVYVISPQKGTLPNRMKLTSTLWEHGIGAETQHKNNVKMLTQLQYCEEKQIDFAVVIAGDEIERKVVKLRHIGTRKEWEVPEENMVEELRNAFEKQSRGEFIVEE